MRKDKKTVNRRLMQELETAIRDLKKIQKQRDRLIEEFQQQKTSFNAAGDHNPNGTD